MGCKFCNRKVKLDKQGIYYAFNNEKYFLTGACVGVDSQGKVYLESYGDDYSDRYYPKYCPECGRKLIGVE